ncbi:MAG: hypothetical protein GEU74_10840 [Nitriliruptorales bacterium]|nr:hypothetical protein [Nitriliruptorales bacterium]
MGGANLTADQAAETTMYTSCEACPMCSGVIVYSGLGRVVYALSTPQVDELKGGSVPKPMRGTAVLPQADRRIRVEGPFLSEEAAAPHAGYWVSE